jgi:excisionase family DNA binding protein
MIKLYNVKEVSKILSLSVSCLYKMAERKEIQSVKIGSALRFLESDIQSFIEKCKTIKPAIVTTTY